MKIKKLQRIMLYTGIGSVILGCVFFVLAPMLVDSGFQYEGFGAFLEGIKNLFSFNFGDEPTLMVFFLFGISVICLIFWAIVVIKNKSKKSIVTALVSLACLFLIFSVFSTCFAARVTFNDQSGILYDLISQTEEGKVGKILFTLAIGFCYLSLLNITLYAFVDLLPANKEVVHDVKTEQVVIVKEVPVVVEQSEDNSTLEDRKAREEKLFKECVDSGYFDEYEEYEFENPIPGLEEEIVVEEFEIDEETVIHQNFDPRKNMKITIR